MLFDHPLTILVGKNGSGKSTFMKLIKSMGRNQSPDNYFFETEWDKFYDKGKSQFQYKLNGIEYKEVKTEYFGWVCSTLNQSLDSNKDIKEYIDSSNFSKSYDCIIDIEFKSFIGAFEKNVFFDNQTSKLDLKYKAEYARTVTKKVQQSIDTKLSNGKKAKIVLMTTKMLEIMNIILGKKYDEVKIISHRFFSGTWGTSIIFKENEIYSEANAGSGEFIIANVIYKLSTAPKGALVLLDEPELSLHPGAQKRLLNYLLEQIIAKKLQIVLSTHSQSFVELAPSKCIKNFVTNKKGEILIEQGVNYLNAFDNLEIDYDVPEIIVEDHLAKKLITKILEDVSLSRQFNVVYFSGGSSSIKTSLITVFSKCTDNNKFILFDGDMYKKDAVDLSSIAESKKSTDYLQAEIKEITGIKISTFPFHVDGGVNGANHDQKKQLYQQYIDYYRDRVYFLPKKIPEDIIYDREYMLQIASGVDMIEVDLQSNSKEKFKLIADYMQIPIDSLYDIFISYFIKNKKKKKIIYI